MVSQIFHYTLFFIAIHLNCNFLMFQHLCTCEVLFLIHNYLIGFSDKSVVIFICLKIKLHQCYN